MRRPDIAPDSEHAMLVEGRFKTPVFSRECGQENSGGVSTQPSSPNQRAKCVGGPDCRATGYLSGTLVFTLLKSGEVGSSSPSQFIPSVATDGKKRQYPCCPTEARLQFPLS
jgi:hypothetical protein